MKSRCEVLVSTVVCVVLFLPVGRTEVTPYRNVWMRTIDLNGTQVSIGSRIHGGTFAPEGEFKHMVFLLSYRSKMHTHPESTCSASLIHPNWVLTAAHCISPAMIAVAGRANLVDYWQNGRSKTPFLEEIDQNRFGVQERKVRQVYVHPKYSSVNNERDLALLHLDVPFETSPGHPVPVAVLPLSEVEMKYATKCTAMGWGLNDHQIQSLRLMFATVYGRTTAYGCHYLKQGPFICLEEGGPGICKGDSGSPLVCNGLVWGVASFSLSPIANSDCSSGNEEYYCQIYPDLNWIRETMKNGVPSLFPLTHFPLLFLAIYPLFIKVSS